jgi:hypothetical protein
MLHRERRKGQLSALGYPFAEQGQRMGALHFILPRPGSLSSVVLKARVSDEVGGVVIGTLTK